MSFITTYCSHCFTRNRLPAEKMDSNAKCGRCKSSLFGITPVIGREDQFDILIQSDLHQFFNRLPANLSPTSALSKSTRNNKLPSQPVTPSAAFPPWWYSNRARWWHNAAALCPKACSRSGLPLWH